MSRYSVVISQDGSDGPVRLLAERYAAQHPNVRCVCVCACVRVCVCVRASVEMMSRRTEGRNLSARN